MSGIPLIVHLLQINKALCTNLLLLGAQLINKRQMKNELDSVRVESLTSGGAMSSSRSLSAARLIPLRSAMSCIPVFLFREFISVSKCRSSTLTAQ